MHTQPDHKRPRARLLAIVSVSPQRRVQCQNPGCGHGVYAAIHVVDDGGQLMVLGSTCFAKRFGGAGALGLPAYSAGGSSGRLLSDEERQILITNAAELLARFQSEHERVLAESAERVRAARLRLSHPPSFRPQAPAPRPPPPGHPWPWQHARNSSIAVLRAPDGQAWIRVQHQDGSQKLVPWPAFPGWEHALPANCGTPDNGLAAYSVPDIVAALQGLRQLGFSQPEVSRWPDVLRLVRK